MNKNKQILLALDLDGTLLTDKGELKPTTKNYLNKVIEKGHKVCIVTGRYFKSIQKFILKENLRVPIISSNGAMIKDPFTSRVIYKNTVPISEVKKIVKYIFEVNSLVHLFSENNWYVNKVTDDVNKFAKENGIKPKIIKSLCNCENIDVIKMVVVDNFSNLNKFEQRIKDNKISVNLFRSDPFSIDVISKTSSKGKGIEILAKKLGMENSKIIAAGNYFNDIEMFKVADFSVAVSNSPQEVKNYADKILASNNEEGIVEILKELTYQNKF